MNERNKLVPDARGYKRVASSAVSHTPGDSDRERDRARVGKGILVHMVCIAQVLS